MKLGRLIVEMASPEPDVRPVMSVVASRLKALMQREDNETNVIMRHKMLQQDDGRFD